MDRNWNEDPTPAMFQFAVLVPWYRSGGFLAMAGGASVVIAVLLGLHVSNYFNLAHLVERRTRNLRELTSELSKAEERERKKIASDLHDRIGHGLAAIKMKIASIQKRAKDQDIIREMDAAKELASQTIQDARSLTFEISPPILYELGLGPALRSLVAEFKRKFDLEIRLVDHHRSKALSADARGFLFRAVRELLFNVVKHAQARQAEVILSEDENSLRIEIVDDGVGMDVGNLQTHGSREMGFGLFGIRERIEYLNGTFECASRPAEGTRITLCFPLSGDEEEE